MDAMNKHIVIDHWATPHFAEDFESGPTYHLNQSGCNGPDIYFEKTAKFLMQHPERHIKVVTCEIGNIVP